MKIAKYWIPYKDKKLKCTLCRHNCLVYPGQAGICQVRVNLDGTLYSLVYAKPVSIHVDPIEKKPLFHFLPGANALSLATVGCNFKCANCQNYEISQYKYEGVNVVPGEFVSPEKVVELAIKTGSEVIAYTYTEPTIFWEYVIDIARLAKEKGIKNILVTNGYISEEALKDGKGIIDAANIDFKSMRKDFYSKVVKARLDKFLDSLIFYKKIVPWIEVTTLIIPGLNDSEEELRDIARFIVRELGAHTPWHISRFFPQYKLTYLPPTPKKTITTAVEIGYEEGLRFVYAGNIPGSPYETTFCPVCHTPLIKRLGYEIVENNIDKGRCPACGEKIEGVWKISEKLGF